MVLHLRRVGTRPSRVTHLAPEGVTHLVQAPTTQPRPCNLRAEAKRKRGPEGPRRLRQRFGGPHPEDLEVIVGELDRFQHATCTEVTKCFQDVLTVFALVETSRLQDVIQSEHFFRILTDSADRLPDDGTNLLGSSRLLSTGDGPSGLGGELELAIVVQGDQTLGGQRENVDPAETADVLASGVNGGEGRRSEGLGHDGSRFFGVIVVVDFIILTYCRAVCTASTFQLRCFFRGDCFLCPLDDIILIY